MNAHDSHGGGSGLPEQAAEGGDDGEYDDKHRQQDHPALGTDKRPWLSLGQFGHFRRDSLHFDLIEKSTSVGDGASERVVPKVLNGAFESGHAALLIAAHHPETGRFGTFALLALGLAISVYRALFGSRSNKR